MGGFSSVTGDEDIMFADNVSFDGTYRSGKVTTDGELLIGSTAAPHIKKGSLTSSDASVTITAGSGTIDLKAGAAVPTTFVAEDASSAVPVANILNVVGTATNGINTTAAGNTLTVAMSSPYEGNFTFQNNTAATTLGLTVDNNDNDPGSTSLVHVIATPGGGDAFTLYEISGATRYFAMGIDNSDSDYFKFTHNTDPSSANTIFMVNPAASTFTNYYANLLQTQALVAGGVNTIIQNTNNTNIASDAFLRLDVGGASAGDPFIAYLVTGAGKYAMGIDNTVAGDPFKITNGNSPSDGTDLISMTSTGVITLNNDLDVTEGGTGVSTLTSHGILMGNGTGDIQATAEPTDGQLLIGDTGGFPILGSLASAGGTVVITPGAGTINLEAGASVPTTFTAENASTCAPALNNLNIVGTATNGINTTAAGSTMTVAMASPYSDGDFTFSTATAGTDRALTVSNSDNSAAASAAHLQVTVGGATSTGDPYTNYLVTGAGTYSVGIDNSDSDEFKITTGASPSAGTELFTMTNAGSITLALPLPVGSGGTGLTSLALTNIFYVNKAGNDGYTGTDPLHPKLTIQAAVTAAGAGSTILVDPGTYTETITHSASNVCVIATGTLANTIIQQADANVVNIGSQTGICYYRFTIQCTAATTAISTITASTGMARFSDCNVRMVSSANIVAAAQPSIASLTGAGTLIFRWCMGEYLHTGSCGAGGIKAAFLNFTGGSIVLSQFRDLIVTNSGTALLSTVIYDQGTTGDFAMRNSEVTITDPDATAVVGIAYISGTGTDEIYRNNIHVVATNNTGYGVLTLASASILRFTYNHIHITDVAGLSYSFVVGLGSTVISQFDDIIADNGYTNAGTLSFVSSEADGNLTLQATKASGTELLTIANKDNTATVSNAALNVSVGGATSTGDPYTNYLVTGAGTYSVGIDNSDSDEFKITTGASPSAGTELFTMTSAGVITLANDLDVSEGGTGVSTLTSHGILMGNGAGDINATAEPTNGQILIGSTGNFPTLGTITAGAGVTVTNAAGSITIASSSGGCTWTDATNAAYNLAAQNGYITDRGGGVTYTLPASGALGDIIKIVGKTGLAVVAQNANQQVCIGNTATTVGVGGTLTATDAGDCLTLVCITAGASTVWRTETLVGNWTVV